MVRCLAKVLSLLGGASKNQRNRSTATGSSGLFRVCERALTLLETRMLDEATSGRSHAISLVEELHSEPLVEEREREEVPPIVRAPEEQDHPAAVQGASRRGFSYDCASTRNTRPSTRCTRACRKRIFRPLFRRRQEAIPATKYAQTERRPMRPGLSHSRIEDPARNCL